MRNFFNTLPRQTKRLVMIISDAVMLPTALWCAVAIRLGEWSPELNVGIVNAMLLIPVFAIPIFMKIGLYRAITRYFGERVLISVIEGVTLLVLLLVTTDHFIGATHVPRSSFIIFWSIAVLYIVGSRLLVGAYFRRMDRISYSDRVTVAIYGAGETGIKLFSALQTGKHFNVVAFIDDSIDLQGTDIFGVRVYPFSSFGKIVAKFEIESVLLAIPSATRTRRSEIIRAIGQFKLPVKTIPDMVDLMNGLSKVDEVREVQIEDLLGRETVKPMKRFLEQCIKGKSVMVTGAGGSIGSELCRQILRHEPTHLILFEKSELALYQIDQELSTFNTALKSPVSIVPILGSITHRRRLEHVLKAFGVQTVYHAAAYKHVPLVEHNLIEGVLNNVFGTWRVADAARNTGVETFVLISTDKAVRPTNVMGASKRFAELVLQAYAREGGTTRYCMVRFGNVLGSSGSVVPLFKKQIEKGGPVTITHPEITRYFMTIPEAAGLVLQAGAMGLGGDVFVLNMGAPIMILDLACKMIQLSGFEIRDESNPEGEIEIQFTGLRPGEKLHEELLIGENVSDTEHPLIMRAEEVELPWSVLHEKLDQIESACHQFDCETVRAILLEVVDGYNPTGGIYDHAWEGHRRLASDCSVE